MPPTRPAPTAADVNALSTEGIGMAQSELDTEAHEAISKAIVVALKNVPKLTGANQAAALKDLAEALAWLRVPGESHGGGKA